MKRFETAAIWLCVLLGLLAYYLFPNQVWQRLIRRANRLKAIELAYRKGHIS